jgi:hypothetical protein
VGLDGIDDRASPSALEERQGQAADGEDLVGPKGGVAQRKRMSRASSSRPVARHSPRSAMKVSLPKSVNQG